MRFESRRATVVPHSSRRVIDTGCQPPLEVDVRASARAQRGRVVVHRNGRVEVVVPTGTTEAGVDRLIALHRDWIVDRSARARARRAGAPRLELARRGAIPVQGEWIPLALRPGDRALATLIDGRLEVRGPRADAQAAILRWYRRHARTVIADAVESESKRLRLEPGALSVRDQRTRWGSCSRRGDLSFSWRLVLAPPEVLRYVVVHELCHLERHDHSPAFWELVEQAHPGWRREAAWLRTYGADLLEFAPTVEQV